MLDLSLIVTEKSLSPSSLESPFGYLNTYPIPSQSSVLVTRAGAMDHNAAAYLALQVSQGVTLGDAWPPFETVSPVRTTVCCRAQRWILLQNNW